MRTWLSVLLGGLVLLTSAPGFAQSRGGRFGGSRFGRSSSSGSRSSGFRSRSSSSSSSSRSRSFRSRSSSTPRYTPPSSSSSRSSSRSRYSGPPSYRDPRFRAAPLAGAADLPSAEAWPPAEVGEASAELEPLARVEHPRELAAIDPEDGAGHAFLTFVVGLCALGFIGFVVYSRRSKQVLRAAREEADAAALNHFEVRRVSVAFDWTERERIQRALDEMAGEVNTDSSAAFLEAARGARGLLRSGLAGARYAAIARFHTSAAEAESRFTRVAQELAVRFREETHHDAIRVAREAMTARAVEGEGLVVVTLLVATSTHLAAFPSTLDHAALDRVLARSLPPRGDDLVAFEVIWSPSEDGDRMSSAELETLYPDLIKLTPGDESVGRVQCSYCRAIYPAELGECPSCGAPRG